MSIDLLPTIVRLSSPERAIRATAAAEIYRAGRLPAERATRDWWKDAELSALLLGRDAVIIVGVAVQPETFFRIREANGEPPLANVPPDQDAQEFELKFPGGVSLDILTTRKIGGTGAIAHYLGKFGEGVQQVEFLCKDVDRATQIVKEKFGIAAIYPATRPGADGTRVNFFLVGNSDGSKSLIELFESPDDGHSGNSHH